MKSVNTKINVLQVMPEFGLAGAETMCECLVNHLIQSGRCNVFVVSLFDFHSAITERLERSGVEVIYLHKKKGSDLSIIPRLWRIMREKRIDVVHTHRYVMQYAIPAAILAGVPVRIHTVHNIATKEVDAIRRKIAALFYRYCHVIPVSISPLITKTIVEEYHLPKKQIPMVYNGIDLSKCLIKDTYQQVDSTFFRFIHIGRFSRQKNHDVIIEAANRLKEKGWQFCIDLIGGGELELEYKNRVKELDLVGTISFCGLQTNVYPYLKRADVFILPSLYEGMPITLIEAMGCGLPIIASRVGGIPDMIVNEENGLLINADAQSLADAMEKLMDNTSLRERLGLEALAQSQRFSAKKMSESYLNIYESNLKCR